MFIKKNINIPLLSMLTTIAVVISLLENFVPLDFIIVGAKLGLANIVTIFVIYYIGKYEAFLILIVRILIVTLLSGRISSILFSLLGGILAFWISCILMKGYNKNVTFVGISVMGCAFHHIGQIIAGIIMLSNMLIITYLPYLLLISIPIGYIIGRFLEILIPKLKNIFVNNFL